MKKVGIITMFHGSLNFGGVLQACALCKALDQLGIPSEQIRCVYAVEEEKRTLRQTVKKLLNPKVVINRIQYELNGLRSEQQKNQRRETFETFNERYVPSSTRVYTSANIQDCLPEYDAFITGSDQVWNPEWYCPTMFLDFVPGDKPKIAYAASIGKSSLTETQQARFREHLKDYQAVSVREADAVELISPLSPVPVECVLDPTLLLTQEQWDEVCADRLVEGDYLFYYFLGKDANEAALAEEYARKNGWKIVGIPSAAGDFGNRDRIHYDQKFMNISPAEFLSLIKFARCVFTDSFHATVFSCLFRKAYFVFPRSEHSGMSGRVRGVAALFGTLDRFCDVPEKKTLDYVQNLAPVEDDREYPELEKRREASLAYLKKNFIVGE